MGKTALREYILGLSKVGAVPELGLNLPRAISRLLFLYQRKPPL